MKTEKSCDNCIYSIPDWTNECNSEHYCSNQKSEKYGYNAEYLNGCDEWKSIVPNLGNNGSICTKTGVNDEDRTTDGLISRKMAIDAVEKKIRYTDHDEPVVDWNDFVAALCFLPYAQPKRNSGQLLYHHTENIDEMKTADVYFCSFCKKEVLKKIRFGMFKGELDIKYGYCPHCGADMRGEEDENKS